MIRTKEFDLSLYLVTDPDLIAGRPLLQVVRAAVEGGVSLVQIRDKQGSARAVLDLAQALKAELPLHVPLIINDRVDIAAAAGVGCHVGQTDLPVAAARDLLGDDAIIGLSIDRIEQLEQIDRPGLVDYIAHGPFRSTATKPDAGAPVGEAGLRAVRSRSPLPLVAIGGIDVSHASAAIAAGANGVAVISAIMAAADPFAAARLLRQTVDHALAQEDWS